MNMYFMAVVLPPHLDAEIIKYKYYMLEKYEAKVGLKSPAHITIIPPFWLHPEKEEGLRTDLDVLGRQVTPFELATHNFSAFKPRTIFIDVEASEPLNELKKKGRPVFLRPPPIRDQGGAPPLPSAHHYCHPRPPQSHFCRSLALFSEQGVPEKLDRGGSEPAAAQQKKLGCHPDIPIPKCISNKIAIPQSRRSVTGRA